MYFFKDTNGNWIIGESVDSIVSKVPCELRKSSPTTVAVRTVESRILLLAPIEVTALRKNAAGDFYANYAEFVAAVSDFFDNAPITAEEVDAKIGAEVDILSDRIDTVENIANASTGGSLGSIKPTDPAPTPARNGNYTFSIGGAKPAWLTAEAGVTDVKAGDGVAVVYAAPSSYTYTHINVSSEFVTIQELNDLGYLFKGVAIPTTDPGTPDGNLFYFASEKGVYANFGGIELSGLNVNILMWNGEWLHIDTGMASTKLQIKRIHYIGRDDITGIVNGNLYWDGLNSRLMEYGQGQYIDYDDKTLFLYDNTLQTLILTLPSIGNVGVPKIINECNIPKIAIWETTTGEPDIFTQPHRFGDYFYSTNLKTIYTRIDLWWDRSTNSIPDLKLFEHEGIIYQKHTSELYNGLKSIPFKEDLKFYNYPVLWCTDKSMVDKFLGAIADMVVYGVKELDELWINRLYVSDGNFNIELAYTTKSLLDGDNYGFNLEVPITNFDFTTNKITEIVLNSNTVGFHAEQTKAVMYINFSKVSQDLQFYDSNHNKSVMRFATSVVRGTYPNNLDLLLPAKIPVIVDRPFRLVMESACIQTSMIDKMLGRGFEIVTSLGGKEEIQEYSYSGIGTYDFQAYLLENGVRKKYAKMGIKTIYGDVGNGITKKIVVCGDSKTDNETKLQHLITLFDADVMNVQFLGTKGTIPNEGYSGLNILNVTKDATLNGHTNPFYDSSISGTYKFNIAKFIESVNDIPDILFIDHGANQGGNDFASEIKPAYDFIISNILAYNAANSESIKIVISIQESAALIPSVVQTGGLTNGKYSFMRHGREMLDNYDNRENEGIFICAQYLNVDCENDFPYALVPAFNNIGVLVKKTTDSAHPGAQSFDVYNASTTYNKGSQVTNGGEYFVAIKNGVVGIAPNDDKINWAKVVDGIGAGYKNIAEMYFNVIKYIQSLS